MVFGYLLFAGSAVALFQTTGAAPHAGATPAFVFGSILYGMAFAVAGGYIASAIARRTDALAAMLVGLIIAAGAAISLVFRAPDTAVWSQLAAFSLMAPCAIAGGIVRARTLRGERR